MFPYWTNDQMNDSYIIKRVFLCIKCLSYVRVFICLCLYSHCQCDLSRSIDGLVPIRNVCDVPHFPVIGHQIRVVVGLLPFFRITQSDLVFWGLNETSHFLVHLFTIWRPLFRWSVASKSLLSLAIKIDVSSVNSLMPDYILIMCISHKDNKALKNERHSHLR